MAVLSCFGFVVSGFVFAVYKLQGLVTRNNPKPETLNSKPETYFIHFFICKIRSGSGQLLKYFSRSEYLQTPG